MSIDPESANNTFVYKLANANGEVEFHLKGTNNYPECIDYVKSKCTIEKEIPSGNGIYYKCNGSDVGLKLTNQMLITQSHIDTLRKLIDRIINSNDKFYKRAFAIPDLDSFQICNHEHYSKTSALGESIFVTTY